MSDASPFPNAPWPRPQPLPLPGRFVSLLPLDADADAAELFAISHRDEETKTLWHYLAFGPFPNASAYAAYLREWTSRHDVVAFTVRSTATREALGSISLMAIRPEHGVAELGNIWYAPVARRTKANTEASYLLLRHCFSELGYRRTEWKCNTDNQPSARAARRLGFTYEGTFRQHMVAKGRNRDTAWFSMLDHEWPLLAATLEHWLYTDDSRPLATLREST